MNMQEPPIEIVHYAAPWGWWSWGLEPVLQRLREVYGDAVKVTSRMGGQFETLDGWMREYGVDRQGTVDWVRESVAITNMPVAPDYYFRTGVASSYPPCLAGEAGAKAFAADREEMHRSGVNFLSLLIRNRQGEAVVKGEAFAATPFEEIVDRLAPGLPKRSPADILEYAEHHRGLTTAHEVAEVFRIPDADAADRLRKLASAGGVGGGGPRGAGGGGGGRGARG